MPFFIQLLAFFGIFISFTSSLSNRVGDNCVNCRKDVLLPAIRDNIQVVTPTIGDCKNCNNKLTKNNGHTLTSVVYKENHSLDVLTILVTSDGSQARPYCSWNGACRYDSSVETVCAEKLCEASGFSYDSSTVFVSSSGNMCESGNNIIDGYVWYYLVNQGYYEYGNYYLESAITARCVDSSTFTSIQPSQYPTTTSTTGKPTARLSSPSSKPTSYPSFRPTSNPNNTRKPTSRAPVKPTPVPSRRQPSRRPSKLPTVNPTAVTPSIAGSLITSDGSQARPYCTWSNVCQYDLSVEILCAAKLCEASGFSYDPSTVFVSSSGSMCVYDIYQGYAWYYVVDVGDYNYSDYILESAITARCVA